MIKGRLIVSVDGMKGKGDCQHCPIAVWEPDWDYGPEVYWCPLVQPMAVVPVHACPMEFIEVEDE